MNWDVSPSFWGMSLFPGLEQNTLGNFLDALLELELDTYCLDYIEGMSLLIGLEQRTLGNFLDAFLELELVCTFTFSNIFNERVVLCVLLCFP